MLKMECTGMLQNPATVVSLDDLMKTWRLCMIAYSNTKALYDQLSCSLQPSPFVTCLNSRNLCHIFYYWIRSCDGIASESSVSRAIEIVYNKILRSVAFLKEVRDTISDDNLLYIVIVQSTALLYLASLAWKKTFFIPKIFIHVVFTFDLLNNQGKSFSLIKACVKEAQQNKSDLPRLGRNALNLLQKILNFLLGELNRDCNILARALRSENKIIPLYYIVLILTSAANLYIARPNLENEHVHRYLVLLQTKMESLLNITRKPDYADYVYYTLNSTSSVPQLFLMAQTLLVRVKNKEMYQIFPSHDLHVARQIDGFPYIQFKPVEVDISLLDVPKTMEEKDLEEEVMPSDVTSDINIDTLPEFKENDLPVLLKENMIENNFCKICEVNISSDVSGIAQAQASLERQDSNESEYEIHINSLDHKENKVNYEHYRKCEQEYNDLKSKALSTIDQLKKLPFLSSEDDSKITTYEKELLVIHRDVDSIVTSGDTWLNMLTILTTQLNKLQQTYQKLQDIRCHDQDKTQHEIEQMDVTEHDSDIEDVYPEAMLKQRPKKKKH